MEPIRCMIVDDEPLAVELIRRFVERTSFLQFVSSYTDAVEAVGALKEMPVDLLFLDIQMPDLDGMSFAEMVPPETRIIFTTAFKQYALDSYGVNALDFLLKPISYARFLKAAEKAQTWFEMARQGEKESAMAESKPQRDTIFLRVDGELKQVDIRKILYVSGMKNYVMFYMEGNRRPIITHLTMKAVEDILPPSQFMRVHRSYIVALQKIRSIDRNNTMLIGDEFIHVGEAYQDAFNAYLKDNLPG